jgi:dihydroorotase-like cyclic amidohydrolase
MADLIIRNGEILVESELEQADLIIESGKVTTITKGNLGSSNQPIDATNIIVLVHAIDLQIGKAPIIHRISIATTSS